MTATVTMIAVATATEVRVHVPSCSIFSSTSFIYYFALRFPPDTCDAPARAIHYNKDSGTIHNSGNINITIYATPLRRDEDSEGGKFPDRVLPESEESEDPEQSSNPEASNWFPTVTK